MKCVASFRSSPASDVVESRKTSGDGLPILRRPRQERAVSPSESQIVLRFAVLAELKQSTAFAIEQVGVTVVDGQSHVELPDSLIQLAVSRELSSFLVGFLTMCEAAGQSARRDSRS